MWVYWVALACLLIIIEFLTVSFVAIFFALAALVTAILSAFITNLKTLSIVFAIISIFSILAGRPILQKYFKVNREVKPSTIDAIIGKYGIVTKEISPSDFGLVKVEGETWTAISENGETILDRAKVSVVKIDGVKLIVKKSN